MLTRAEFAGVLVLWEETATRPPSRRPGAPLSWLDDHERRMAARFRFDEDRRDYVAAHLMLRRVLAASSGIHPASIRLRHEPNRRPTAEGIRLPFSLTHCRGLVACAVAASSTVTMVGVDAEPLSSARRVVGMADFILSPREREWASAPGGARSFRLVALWTAKEAVLKARGVGLRDGGLDGLRATACLPVEDDAGSVRFRTAAGEDVWTRRAGSEHVLSVARTPVLDQLAA